MVKKNITLYLLFLFLAVTVNAQNRQVLYNFADLPQSLLLNPAIETNYKFHIGVPLLSGFSADFGSTGFTVSDLFANNNVSFNDKVNNVLNSLTERDFLKINTQIEILSGGYRYNNKLYFSFGFYQETDGIIYFPNDGITFITEGNASFLNRNFTASQLLYKLDVLGVLHFGVTKKINEKLSLGGRFKIYSSALNLETANNSGTLTTIEGTNNIFTHTFSDVDIELKTSGLVNETNDEFITDVGSYLKNTFFGSNLGIGIDFGFTYNVSKQLEITGSILDFGFVRHKKNIKNSFVKGDYIFEGIQFNYDTDNQINYWRQLDEDFRENVPSGSNLNPYTSFRPTKINSSLRYSFGEKRSKYCYDNTYKDFYKNAVGVQLFSIFRPLSPQVALTGFYETSLSKKFHAKVTYTVDDYSLYNIGAGISCQIGKINFYGMVDNLAQFNDIASTNSMNIQLGFNTIFN